MAKNLKLDTTINCIRAARVNVEDAVKNLIGGNSALDPAPYRLGWINKEIAEVYCSLLLIESELIDREESRDLVKITESKGVTKSETKKETCTENGKSDTVVESAGTKAGLGEKSEPVAPAPASDEKPVAPAAEEKAPEVKTASESVDLGSEKLERGRLCSALFGSLKSKLGAKEAKEKVRELIDSFCGAEASTAADSVTHERHAEFVSYIKKHIDEAQNA